MTLIFQFRTAGYLVSRDVQGGDGTNLKEFLIPSEDGEPRTYRVRTIGDFISVATWLYGNEQVVFRGQRRYRPLLPSVARDLEYIDSEIEIITEFKREAIPYLTDVPKNLWQWLAVAQHNGLPTRLLDWTKNPLTALWFAVSKPTHGKEPGVVWAHGYGSSHIISNTEIEPSPFEIESTRIYFPEHVFPYIQAQSGLFTVHHRDANKFTPFEKRLKDADLLLTKIEIPAECFPTLRYHLYRSGVHPASLYPGLPGLVQRIRYQHEFLDDEKLA